MWRSISIPARAAAARDEPIATVCCPKRVKASSSQSTEHDDRGHDRRQRYSAHVVDPEVRPGSGTGCPRRSCRSLTTRLRPVPIPSVPSVAMNELTRRRVTISPFTRPKAVPVADGGGDARGDPAAEVLVAGQVGAHAGHGRPSRARRRPTRGSRWRRARCRARRRRAASRCRPRASRPAPSRAPCS